MSKHFISLRKNAAHIFRSCLNKRRYRSKKKAKQSKIFKNFSVYHCSNCNGYHRTTRGADHG